MKLPKSESKTVEFKKTFNQDVIASLVSFANADGGSVYVGVRDDGKVLGVTLAAESETTWVNEIKSKTLGGCQWVRRGVCSVGGSQTPRWGKHSPPLGKNAA